MLTMLASCCALLLVLPHPDLTRVPVDSLGERLRRMEQGAVRPTDAAQAALLLARLHYARAEYRAAASAFARAAARLDPARKPEALYGQGLSWLALKTPDPARAAFSEIPETAPEYAGALLGTAFAWELAGRADRAIATLDDLLARDPGEAGPPALERYAALADHLQRPEDARRARMRLLAQYPGSLEAAAASTALRAPEPLPALHAAAVVETEDFAGSARARALLARALRAGFTDARVIERGEGRARSYRVRLGRYPDPEQAKTAAARAARVLGIAPRVEGER